ncbi:hypothetical protein L3X38_002187 [Prunus dulcis]|uniref:Uncharacterized protein n=1 Tax=Prunus dulcis TaxID=3755 RepID=A0AAD4ZKI9_PRUDU|nr:hypothetical protein L3X38_002187 [Prunus dulcis]
MTNCFCFPKTNPDETSVTKRNYREPAPNINSNSPKGKGTKAFNFRGNDLCDNKGDTVGVFNFGNKKTEGCSGTDKQDGGSNINSTFNFEDNKIQRNQAKKIVGFCDFGNEY